MIRMTTTAKGGSIFLTRMSLKHQVDHVSSTPPKIVLPYLTLEDGSEVKIRS
jgi:hypothetical protein